MKEKQEEGTGAALSTQHGGEEASLAEVWR